MASSSPRTSTSALLMAGLPAALAATCGDRRAGGLGAAMAGTLAMALGASAQCDLWHTHVFDICVPTSHEGRVSDTAGFCNKNICSAALFVSMDIPSLAPQGFTQRHAGFPIPDCIAQVLLRFLC